MQMSDNQTETETVDQNNELFNSEWTCASAGVMLLVFDSRAYLW